MFSYFKVYMKRVAEKRAKLAYFPEKTPPEGGKTDDDTPQILGNTDNYKWLNGQSTVLRPTTVVGEQREGREGRLLASLTDVVDAY